MSGKRSRTAQGVAAERAVLTDLGVLDDPVAGAMLDPAMRAIVGFVRWWPDRVRSRSVTLAGLAARVRWFDAQVAGALDDGLDQVATIGAGYDARPWRFGRDDVRFFELDHAATQQDKRARAPRPGPTYVESDLGRDGAADALRAGGLDTARPALFVVEGVTMYLTEDVLRRQLADLATSSGAGSRLAVDFYPARAPETVPHQRQLRLQRLARTGSGESLRLGIDRADAVALVEDAGWHVREATGLRAAAQDLVPRASGLPIDAVSDRKTLVAAVRP